MQFHDWTGSFPSNTLESRVHQEVHQLRFNFLANSSRPGSNTSYRCFESWQRCFYCVNQTQGSLEIWHLCISNEIKIVRSVGWIVLKSFHVKAVWKLPCLSLWDMNKVEESLPNLATVRDAFGWAYLANRVLVHHDNQNFFVQLHNSHQLRNGHWQGTRDLLVLAGLENPLTELSRLGKHGRRCEYGWQGGSRNPSTEAWVKN